MGANGRGGKELEKVVIEKSGRGPVLLANDHECGGQVKVTDRTKRKLQVQKVTCSGDRWDDRRAADDEGC